MSALTWVKSGLIYIAKDLFESSEEEECLEYDGFRHYLRGGLVYDEKGNIIGHVDYERPPLREYPKILFSLALGLLKVSAIPLVPMGTLYLVFVILRGCE